MIFLYTLSGILGLYFLAVSSIVLVDIFASVKLKHVGYDRFMRIYYLYIKLVYCLLIFTYIGIPLIFSYYNSQLDLLK